ncbi:MAG: formimidoylglutamase [Chitinophagaceae bacterium]
MNLAHFKTYTKQDIHSLTRLRKFETKLGERIAVLNNVHNVPEALAQLAATYVVFGIPEDIGVQANFGRSGASTAWISFLQSFLNVQSNDFMNGDEFALIGHFDFNDIQYLINSHAQNNEEKVEACRHAVNAIDEEVEGLVKLIISNNKIPIAIGGGHNNAYPMIKGAAKGLHQIERIFLPQINCINLDAHTDYRPREGRHSGNAFRYAEEDGFLQKYFILGLHENYLQQNVWMDIINNPFIDCITYEDIFLHQKRTFLQAVSMAVDFTHDNYCGIEIDLDAVENVLSSAQTPCGVSPVHARQYVNLCAARSKSCYLHICEGATNMNGKTNVGTGKLISYLVSDFIKMKSVN